MTIQHLPELLARCAETFQPRSVDDFIGDLVSHKGDNVAGCGARALAGHLQNAIAFANAHGRESQCLLLAGRSGLGKSMLAKFLQHLTGCNKWNTTKLNGTELKVEKMQEIAQQLATTNLFGDWRMLWVDEADAIPAVAQVRLLTLLDDLPKGVIVVFTTNENLRNFEDRFQSRFQAFRLDPPAASEIVLLLKRYLPEWDVRELFRIAEFACGNVRQALKDTKGLVESLPVAAPAAASARQLVTA